MKFKLLIMSLFLCLSTGLFAQSATLTNTCASGTMPDTMGVWRSVGSSCTNAQSIKTSGGTITINNRLHGVTSSFEEVILGVTPPDTVSIVLKGCMKGGTCDTLDTYTTVANSIRNPVTTKVYDYYTVTASWTGGSGVSVSVNTAITTARSNSGSGGGGAWGSIVGTISSQSDLQSALNSKQTADPNCKPDGSGNSVCNTVTTRVTLLTNQEYDNGTCSTAATINPANGNMQRLTLTAGQTCNLTFLQPASATESVSLAIFQSTTSPYNGTIASTTIKWSGGVAPTITVGSGGTGDSATFDKIVCHLGTQGCTTKACCVASQDFR